MTATLVATPDTKKGLAGGAEDSTAGGTGAATPANQAIPVVLRRGVVDLLRGQGEDAVSIELTLEFGGLVVKHAVAYPGASEPAFGYSCVRVEGVDVWWRQRLVVPCREPVVTTSVRPRLVVVGRIGGALSAVADYA